MPTQGNQNKHNRCVKRQRKINNDALQLVARYVMQAMALMHYSCLRGCIGMQMKINKCVDARTPQLVNAHIDINYKSGAQQSAMVATYVHLILKVALKCL